MTDFSIARGETRALQRMAHADIVATLMAPNGDRFVDANKTLPADGELMLGFMSCTARGWAVRAAATGFKITSAGRHALAARVVPL